MKENTKKDWVNVKVELPNTDRKVIKYSSVMNIGQVEMAVTIVPTMLLKHCDETVYWMDIPKLPVPLTII